MARPKKNIDYETVEKLASIMCTQEEIASVLDLSVRTLQRDAEICRVYKKGLDNARTSLRRNQFKLSQNNPTMAIWLGKQYLGQKDKQLIEHTTNTNLREMTPEQLEERRKELAKKFKGTKDD